MGRNKALAWGRLPVNMHESEMEARPLREAVSMATESLINKVLDFCHTDSSWIRRQKVLT